MYIMRKLLCLTVLMAMFIGCVGVQAQNRYDGFYLSLDGGVSSVNKQRLPVLGLRLGMEYRLFVGEIEVSYLSLQKNDGYNYQRNDGSLSTMIAGVNFGVKFIQSNRGYLAAMLSVGYSLQEDWHKGHGCDYYDYWCYDCGYCCYDYGYGYDCYSPRSRHHDDAYFGIGLTGAFDFTERFGIFAEARYQNIPTEGRGKSKWGFVSTAGLRFYF